ncbi:MAG: hypothetical protein ACTHOH_09235 [Lysobacteraceae bacterium]
MTDLIPLLNTASAGVSGAGIKTSNAKLQKQLLVRAIDLRNLAIVLRRGEVQVAPAAVDACAKELNDTIAAAKAAKTEEGYGRVLAEALEAVEAVEQHLVPVVDPAIESARLFSARAPLPWLTPIPPDVVPPRGAGWPRRPPGWPPHWPWPPRPWPPEPPPWWDEVRNWERGFPR